MQTILIVTLGTRDIQLSSDILSSDDFRVYDSDKRVMCLELKNYPNDSDVEIQKETTLDNVLTFTKPRLAAASIINYFEYFKPYLIFPIIHKTLHWFLQVATFPTEIWWVCTEQNRDAFNEHHWNRDTAGFTGILSRLLKHFCVEQNIALPKFYSLVFETHVSHLDFNYIVAGRLLSGQHSFQDISKGKYNLYLLNQGGIDAINTSILLKITEYRPDAIQLQVSEGEAQCRPVAFPKLISRNFQNRLITRLVLQNRYDIISIMAENDNVKLVANATLQVLNYNWRYFHKEREFHAAKQSLIAIPGGTEVFNDLMRAAVIENRIPVLILIAQWYYQQGLISEMILRLNVLKEYMLHTVAIQCIPGLRNFMFMNGQELKVQELLNTRPELVNWLEKKLPKLKKPIKLTTSVLLHISEYVAQSDTPEAKGAYQIWQSCLKLDRINKNRNDIMHFGEGSDLELVSIQLDKFKSSNSIDNLFHYLRGAYGISGNGFMQSVQKFILQEANPDRVYIQ